MPGIQNEDVATLQARRPVFEVDGEAEAELSQGLLALRIEEDAAGLYRCEATFGNWGIAEEGGGGDAEFLYFKRDILDFGKTFHVKLGADTLFDGRIYGIEADFPEGAPPTFTVLAEDRLQDLRMTRRTRTFLDSSDADVFSRIANDHSLTPSVTAPGPTHPVLAQLNQSDLAFLRDRARAVGVELWVEGSTLNVKPRPDRTGTATPLKRGKELRMITVTADLADQASKVVVSGWDVGNKDKTSHEVGDDVVSSELGDTESGASILGARLAERKQILVHPLPPAADVAQAEAESTFRTLARRFVVARGEAETSANLRAGRAVTFAGLGKLFDGTYTLVEVRHRFDGTRGLRTEFTAERPGLGRPS